MINIDTSNARRRTILNLALNSALFTVFLTATAPRFTGITVHDGRGDTITV
ncbi:MAG: hypothetical protein ACUVSY_13770 [Roseiflexus sp.]